MKVINSGYNYRHKADYVTERPEGLEDYILLVIRSPGRITLDGVDHFVKGNNVIVYSKGSPQFFGAHQAEYIDDWVHFDLNKTDLTFCKRIGIPFDTILNFTDVSPLSRVIELMFNERFSRNPNAEETTAALLRVLFLKLSDLIANNAHSNAYTSRLMILRHRFRFRPEADWSIARICKEMSIGPSYLHESYKKMFGTTIREDVIAIRIERAKDLLINTNHNIATISHMVGYDNDAHFMYIFKKKTGFTPTQYRNSSVSFFR